MTATVYVVLALCALANGAFLRRPHLDGRIIGGVDADIKDYPYQLSVETWGYHSCGGVILNPYWVLTTAQCVVGEVVGYISVRAGSCFRGSGGSVHQVLSIVMHEQYDLVTFDYDFALLLLETPLELGDGVEAVMLADNEPAAGADSVITGWGTTDSVGSLPRQLQVVNVPIVDRASCNDSYAEYGGITPRMICAGFDKGDKGGCLGDSGGPLVVDGELVGIDSWAAGCAAAGYPGVYSNVANQRAWIKDNSGI